MYNGIYYNCIKDILKVLFIKLFWCAMFIEGECYVGSMLYY
jgi:hypothetical protein